MENLQKINPEIKNIDPRILSRIEFEEIAKFIFSNFTDLNNAISFNKGGLYYNISSIEDNYNVSKYDSALIEQLNIFKMPKNAFRKIIDPNDYRAINSYLTLQLPHLIFKQISDKVENNNIGFAIKKRNVEIRGFDGNQYNQKTLLTYNNEELIQYLSKIDNQHTIEYDKISSCDFMHEINPAELYLISLFIDYKKNNLVDNINNNHNQQLRQCYQNIEDNNLEENILSNNKINIGGKNLLLTINNKNYKIYNINNEIFTLADENNIPLNHQDSQEIISQVLLEQKKVKEERAIREKTEKERIEIKNITTTLKQQNKEWANKLADALKNKSDGELDLSSKKINSQDTIMIAKALQNSNCKLRELDFSWNNIKDSGAKAIAEALKSGNCQLQKLALGSNDITDQGAKALAEALQSGNCQLRKLDFRSNKITDSGAKVLAEALQSGNCQLQKLNLSWSKITKEGVKALAEALKSGNCQLQNLTLGGNNITDQGAKALAEALKSGNCQLQKLNIYGNLINDSDAKALAEALKSGNCQLQKLVLSYNNITDSGAKALAEALQSGNCQLQNLDLSWSKITKEGVKALAEALKSGNCKITKIKHNQDFDIDDQCKEMLNNAIKARENNPQPNNNNIHPQQAQQVNKNQSMAK